MSVPSIPGRLAKLEISGDGGTNYVNFSGIVDLTLNVNIDELETTSHDSEGIREYIPNFSDYTADVSARWQDGDPGQGFLLDAIDEKKTLPFRLFMEIAEGKLYWEGNLFATSASPAGPLDDTASLDASLRLSQVVRGYQRSTTPTPP